MKKFYILFFIILNGCANYNTESKINIREKQRNEILITRKILECQNVRRDNANSGVTGFWGGVLMGLRENLACD